MGFHLVGLALCLVRVKCYLEGPFRSEVRSGSSRIVSGRTGMGVRRTGHVSTSVGGFGNAQRDFLIIWKELCSALKD